MQPRKKLRLVCLHWECFYKLWLRSFERINAAGFLFITAVIDQLLFYFKEPEDGGGHCEMLSSRDGVAVPIMTSQLWSLAQDT